MSSSVSHPRPCPPSYTADYILRDPSHDLQPMSCLYVDMTWLSELALITYRPSILQSHTSFYDALLLLMTCLPEPKRTQQPGQRPYKMAT